MWGILFNILVALMQGLIAWEYAYFDFSWFISHHEISKHCLLEFCHHHLPHIFQWWILIFFTFSEQNWLRNGLRVDWKLWRRWYGKNSGWLWQLSSQWLINHEKIKTCIFLSNEDLHQCNQYVKLNPPHGGLSG